MNITLTKRLCLTAMLTLAAAVYTSSAFAETSKLIIESGDSAQSRQQAAMEKEQLATIRAGYARRSTSVQRKSGTKPTQLSIAVINANRALILMRTGSPTPCAASTAALAAPLPHNDCTLKDIERIRYD